jgi:hypothetical protein
LDFPCLLIDTSAYKNKTKGAAVPVVSNCEPERRNKERERVDFKTKMNSYAQIGGREPRGSAQPIVRVGGSSARVPKSGSTWCK